MFRTRKEAKEAGALKYFTGKPCKRGHVSERYTSGPCVKCATEYGARWKAENPEKSRESDKKTKDKYREEVNEKRRNRYAEDPHPHRERSKGYRKENPEKIREANKRNYEKNAEDYREYARIWSLDNKDRRAELRRFSYRRNPSPFLEESHRRRAARLQRMAKDYGELDELCLSEAAKHCRDMEKSTGFPWQIDHMIPLRAETASGLHTYRNIQVIPSRLNSSKCNRLIYTEPLEWLADCT